ncbi:MAG: hypothetical protein AAGA77_11270 [Bacteroidota bacterium]
MIAYLSKTIAKKRVLSYAVKFSILALLIAILYVQVFVKQELSQLIIQFNESLQEKGSWFLISIAVTLVPFNWLLESVKWKVLINQFQTFNIKESIFSVLSGVSLAIMTPGRIGEYGGRLVGIRKRNQPKAILANLISSLSQNIINVGLGLFGALLFLQLYIPLQQNIFFSLIFVSTCITGVMLFIYFRIDLLHGILAYLPKWNWIKKIQKSISAFDHMDTSTLFRILGISLLRYSVYLSQYVLLIFFFGVTDNLLSAILGVITIFFFQSNLPLPPALSVLARGEMAIFLWSVFTDNLLGIIAASFTLWIINLVIPALLGAAIIAQSKIFED